MIRDDTGPSIPEAGRHPRPHPRRWLKRLRLGRADWAVLGMVAAMAGVGLVLIGQGLYIKAKAVLAQELLERAFARALDGEATPKPWPWADTWPVAKLSVPRIGAEAIVLDGVSGEAMAFGPGHHQGTPRPGDAGTAIIAAHRDTHFAFLQHVQVGDAIMVTLPAMGPQRFTVTGTKVVPWNASGIDPRDGGRALALVTCYPFGVREPGPLRYVVEARWEGSDTAPRPAMAEAPAEDGGLPLLLPPAAQVLSPKFLHSPAAPARDFAL